jgi:hypothetical protein
MKMLRIAPLLALAPALIGQTLITQALITQTLIAQKPAPVQLVSPVQDKNFWLLSSIDRTPAVREAVKSNPALAAIAGVRLLALDNAVKTCNLDIECYASHLRFTDEQAAKASVALEELYRTSPAVRAFADGSLADSGIYVRYNSAGGAKLLTQAWADCVRGMNHMMDVYSLGKAPRYPAIDSMLYDPTSDTWRRVIRNLGAAMEDDRSHLDLFFLPSLRFALEVMFLNHRDEAGRFEPMDLTENAAALARVKTVEWAKYKYSVIVVPGAGSDRPGVPLSPGGKLRNEIAARRFRDGLAPFVLVSGGFVHPDRTAYAEAIELKRDLMSRFGIPANAIIVDPHARHTTTNMRNAARLMYRFGMPFSAKALVTTDPDQSQYIEGSVFEKRCLDELGYLPYKLLGRTSPFDLEFVPQIFSLHADPLDPLDP